ncbi:hypothetical protein C7H09_14085 [Marinobacter fuscus]|uniref:Uncharacterized protein n=2 Tax=Marinobacter fuscus TaxID=2109942 RepID=A0A2T1K6Q1_9GAMM|nr:hypothetical protein C7H09_14085 [Marinobacter fuscus]
MQLAEQLSASSSDKDKILSDYLAWRSLRVFDFRKIDEPLNKLKAKEEGDLAELNRIFEDLREKYSDLFLYFSEIEEITDLGPIFRSIKRHGPEEFYFELKKIYDNWDFGDTELKDSLTDFAAKLEKQLFYYDGLRPDGGRNLYKMSARVGSVNLGEYWKYVVLMRRRPQMLDTLKAIKSYCVKIPKLAEGLREVGGTAYLIKAEHARACSDFISATYDDVNKIVSGEVSDRSQIGNSRQ